jgi:hypothetical protein
MQAKIVPKSSKYWDNFDSIFRQDTVEEVKTDSQTQEEKQSEVQTHEGQGSCSSHCHRG